MSNYEGKRFYRLSEVKKITTLSKSTIYAKMKEGLFPKNINITGGRRAVWLEAEIQEWMTQQVMNYRAGEGKGESSHK